jgi:hypothetical protein
MMAFTFLIAITTSVPTLNIESVCHTNINEPKEQADKDTRQCIEKERSTRDELKRSWAQYPVRLRDECAHAISVAPEGNYVELRTCIDIQKGEPNIAPVPSR